MIVQYVKAEDWQGLYINGILVKADHEISIMGAFEELACRWYLYDGNSSVLSVVCYRIDQDWMEESGDFPNVISQIPDDVIELEDEVIFN